MILTTITPYWGRPEALSTWLTAIVGASHLEVCHLVFVVGDPIPLFEHPKIRFIPCEQPPPGAIRPSIGYYHNLGAELANTEWIMKLDVDAIPNEGYFESLVPILERAQPRQWFNGGMVFINRTMSELVLHRTRLPLKIADYRNVVSNLRAFCSSSYRYPAASNFICRRSIYKAVGGCDRGFQGWGWEDYQQMYALEWYERERDPLPGLLSLENAPRRCRDEIGRPKARSLFEMNRNLCLLHRWHPPNHNPFYRRRSISDGNRQVLLDSINQYRNERGSIPHQTQECRVI